MLVPSFGKVSLRVSGHTGRLDIGSICRLAQQLHRPLQAGCSKKHLQHPPAP